MSDQFENLRRQALSLNQVGHQVAMQKKALGLDMSGILEQSRWQTQQFEEMRKRALGFDVSGIAEQSRRQAQQFEEMRKRALGFDVSGIVEQSRGLAQQFEEMRKRALGFDVSGIVEQSRRQAQQFEEMRKRALGFDVSGIVEQSRGLAQQLEEMRKRALGFDVYGIVEQSRRQAQQFEEMRKRALGFDVTRMVEQAREQAKQFDSVWKRALGPDPSILLDQVRQQARQFNEIQGHAIGAHSKSVTQFATALTVAGVLGSFDSRSVVESLAAASLVQTSRSDGVSEGIRGHSVTVDALLAASEAEDAVDSDQSSDQGLLQAVSEIVSVFRAYLASVESVAEFRGLVQLMVLFLAAAQVWFAMKSVGPEDIDKLKFSIEQQTTLIRNDHEVNARRLEVELERFELEKRRIAEEKARDHARGDAQRQNADDRATTDETKRIQVLLEGLVGVLDATANRLAAQTPVATYVSRRDFPLKRERRLTSGTLALISHGTVVHLLSDEKKWMRVRHFDYLSGRLIDGWVPKKYFRRLPK